MIDEPTLRERVDEACGEHSAPVEDGLGGEWVVDVTPECLVSLVTSLLRAEAVHHLTAITGQDRHEGRQLTSPPGAAHPQR